MYYNMDMNLAPHLTQPLELISEGKGNTDLISAYTSSSIGLSDQVTLNVGINAQILTLNNSWNPVQVLSGRPRRKALSLSLTGCIAGWRKWTCIS